MNDLELWGGHECTVLRVGSRTVDQTRSTGHDRRPLDLDRFAALGLRALRYPVLWETVSPDAPDAYDWSFADRSLGRLSALGVRPIVGLVHHGSGPTYTGLLEGSFAPGLARHARQVAERYPWVESFCPVNEPLTTARFSALYGHWHPHHQSERSFWLAVLNQVDGVRASMRAIRAVTPGARLVQTEDLGRCSSTPELAYQAEFDNHRRWMTWDLLAGAVTPLHPMWDHLERLGFGERMRAIADAPCSADVVGLNHYLTSDRFLDHRLERYPVRTHGQNHRERYADVETVRVAMPVPGLRSAIDEAWGRYGQPVALTEVHNGCTREEQMRWMHEAWRTAEAAREEGVDVCGVTAWALLGAHDWNSLLVRAEGYYESGVFALDGNSVQDTAMVPLLRALVRGERVPAVAEEPGWWRRALRVEFGEPWSSAAEPPTSRPTTRLLLVGAGHELAEASVRCRLRGLAFQCRETLALGPAPLPWAVLVVGEAATDALQVQCNLHGIPFARLSAAGELDRVLDRLIDRAGPLPAKAAPAAYASLAP